MKMFYMSKNTPSKTNKAPTQIIPFWPNVALVAVWTIALGLMWFASFTTQEKKSKSKIRWEFSFLFSQVIFSSVGEPVICRDRNTILSNGHIPSSFRQECCDFVNLICGEKLEDHFIDRPINLSWTSDYKSHLRISF